jgi:hypothetical protein
MQLRFSLFQPIRRWGRIVKAKSIFRLNLYRAVGMELASFRPALLAKAFTEEL